jgi:mannose-6-phosphate isomerase-like protein (cupin superfamily)
VSTAAAPGRYDAVTVDPGGRPAATIASSGHRQVETRGSFWTVDDVGRGVRFRAAHVAVDRAAVPRHRHPFEQIYYHLSGLDTFAGRDREPGDCAYHPESVFYGPTRTGPDGAEMITIQFPSPSGGFFGSTEDLMRAMTALRDQGVEVRDGVVVWPDGREQDSTEACWEWLLGGEVPYAPPRYDEPVVVRSRHVPFVPSVVDGVERKHVAYFNECGPHVELLRLRPGTATPAGHSPCAQARFVVDGEAAYDGRRCPAVTFLYYPPGVEHAELTSETGADVLVVALQAPGGAPPPVGLV